MRIQAKKRKGGSPKRLGKVGKEDLFPGGSSREEQVPVSNEIVVALRREVVQALNNQGGIDRPLWEDGPSLRSLLFLPEKSWPYLQELARKHKLFELYELK
jgi:hypothetical protein